MKRVLYALAAALLFLAATVYISAYENPFSLSKVTKLAENQGYYTDNDLITRIPEYIGNGLIWETLNYEVFYTLLATGFLTITSTVVFLHLLFDKLFFRKFYEQPALLPAIRRGLFVGLYVLGALYFRLINGWSPFNLAALALLFIAIEIFVVMAFRKDKLV